MRLRPRPETCKMLAALTLPMSLTMHYVMRLRYNVYARMYVVIMNSSKDRADSRGMIEMIKYLCIRERNETTKCVGRSFTGVAAFIVSVSKPTISAVGKHKR